MAARLRCQRDGRSPWPWGGKDSLGPAGETWEVSLTLSEFRPLQPHLSFSPGGLDLTDVYALTIQEDAGLEINHIELGPAEAPR